MIDYSFVIPFHSNKILLQTCIESLYRTVLDNFEIIIVANNYNEKEIDIKFDYPNLKIIKVIKNLYYAAAINLGVSYAKGNYILFCDTDTVYTPNWFEKLTYSFHNNLNIGFASPKLLNPADGRIIDFGIAFTHFNGPHPFKGCLPTDSLVQKSYYPQAACSASGIINKDIFQKIGGFNEDLGYSYADIELCLRLREKGLYTLCVANSYVYHKGNSVLNEMNTFIKSDIKARFMRYNSSKIKVDLKEYYKISLKGFLQNHTIKTDYFLVDMSSVYDKEWYYEIFKELNISVCDFYHSSINTRDIQKINLYEKLPVYIQLLKYPIIYFVDEFISLQKNILWMQLRNISEDLVIDRNANIRKLQEIVDNEC